MYSTLLAGDLPQGVLRVVSKLLVADRGHHRLYDGPSLSRLLERGGFQKLREMRPGSALIDDPGEFDRFERLEQRVYVEAFK